eukprot:PhM_4_TR10114/c0_g1_i1/m.14463
MYAERNPSTSSGLFGFQLLSGAQMMRLYRHRVQHYDATQPMNPIICGNTNVHFLRHVCVHPTNFEILYITFCSEFNGSSFTPLQRDILTTLLVPRWSTRPTTTTTTTITSDESQ